MNRLVSEDGQLYACGNGLCSEGDIECTNCHYTNKAFLKLAAYENTRLEPEEIKDLKECVEGEEGTQGTVKDLIELMQYRKLESQGLLIKLPCKVGSTVYRILYDRNIENSKVESFEFSEEGIFVRVSYESPIAYITSSYPIEDLYFYSRRS